MDYSVKAIRKQFAEKGVFYTDLSLANMMRAILPNDVKEIYDPTCGNGQLLSVFPDDVQKYGQDIDATQVEVAASRLKNFHGASGDTLKAPAFIDKRFDAIIANPPFSIAWQPANDERFKDLPCLPPKSKADYAFLAHILYMMSDGGTAVVLNFPGILYRGNAEGKIRRWFIERNYIDSVIMIDGGHFADTAIATCLLVLKKHRAAQTIRFEHNEYKRDVAIEEIANEGYDLSVSRYIEEQQPKAVYNPVELERDALNGLAARLDKELTFEETVRRLEGWSMKPVFDALDDVIEKHRRLLR